MEPAAVVASANNTWPRLTPIGAAGRLNRGGSYSTGSDGAAGGPLGPVGPPEGPWGRRGVPSGPVHQSCTDTGQSSDLSSPDGSRRAKIGFRRKPVGTQYGPTGPDEPCMTDHSTVPCQRTTDIRAYSGL